MGTIWIPGAERLGDGSIGGAMDTPNGKPRVTWHVTVSGAGDSAFNAVGRYLIAEQFEPHVLYDPTTDRIGQFGPLNQSARALANDGTLRTNRTGLVNIQIEVLARAETPFTGYWKPGKNFKALMAAIRSWGIPDVFPLPLAATSGDCVRTRSVWLNTAGHYGHCNVPGNNHWDPGKLDTKALFAAAPVATPAPAPAPKPTPKAVVSVAHINAARKKDIPAPTGHTTYKTEVKVVEAALVAEKLLEAKYADGSWGTKTEDAYNAFRRKMGYTGKAATGAVGLESLTKLARRHSFTVKA
jgi:hypothetical protein